METYASHLLASDRSHEIAKHKEHTGNNLDATLIFMLCGAVDLEPL